ncbi:hypothetical protein [Wolbachia endosymbiont of Brugia pahangi]|nr:hypothetical protein [Wolbachia endosymbiont of Brugia pahangi]
MVANKNTGIKENFNKYMHSGVEISFVERGYWAIHLTKLTHFSL